MYAAGILVLCSFWRNRRFLAIDNVVALLSLRSTERNAHDDRGTGSSIDERNTLFQTSQACDRTESLSRTPRSAGVGHVAKPRKRIIFLICPYEYYIIIIQLNSTQVLLVN